MVSLKPEGISDAVAAGICENWMTAWQAMYTIAGLEEGKSVLIHAGCSGVGLAAIQLARKFTKGAIYATAGTDEKVKYTEKMGATKGINYKKEDFAVELSKITNGEGVSVIIDFVGQGYWEQNIASLVNKSQKSSTSKLNIL